MSKDSDKFKKSDVYMTVVLAVLGAILIYYKIELEYPLRQVIAGLAGLLILLTSLMVVIPEDYEWKLSLPRLPKIRYLYIWIPLLGLVIYLLLNPSIYMKQASQVIQRLAPTSYKIVIVNQSGVDSYGETYAKLFKNNGYKNVVYKESDSYPTAPNTTIMFSGEDSVAATEITDLVRQSYGTVQTAPVVNTEKHTIVVILSKGNAE
jgi:hypothetical protein